MVVHPARQVNAELPFRKNGGGTDGFAWSFMNHSVPRSACRVDPFHQFDAIAVLRSSLVALPRALVCC